MIEADLVITGASELVTCAGPPPLRGERQSRAGVIANAGIAVSGREIAFVGTAEEIRSHVRLRPDGELIDAGGACILPGLVDAHTHLPFAGWREADFERHIAGASYAEIARSGGGILTTVRATREASAEDLSRDVRRRLDEMLRTGTTTVEGKSGYGLSTGGELKQLEALAAAREHPVEIVPTLLGAHVVPPEWLHAREQYVRIVAEEMIPAVASRRLAEYCDVFIEEGAFSVEEARRILEAGRLAGMGVRVHAEQFSSSGGAALAAELRAASADHLERIDRAAAKALAAAGVTGILLPGASLFASGCKGAAGRMLIESGLAVAIASDFNPGTCPCESLAAMIPLACLLCGLTPDEAIVAATINAAFSLNRADRIGSLEMGKQADIAVFDVPDRRHLAYRFGSNRCTIVVKAGRIVVRDWRLAREV